MEPILEAIQGQLRRVFSGRSVILAGGVAAAALQPIETLRVLGARRFLVVAPNAGNGAMPEGPDVEVYVHETAISPDLVAGFRDQERAVEDPPAAVRAVLERFDAARDAIVVLPPFLDARELAGRPAFGARRSEWVALEDKTIADALFDATGVPRPPSVVVAADAASIAGAERAVNRGAGTVWSGDARDGFNGGGAHVRWVVDADDRRDALDVLLPRCDRVRVASFVEGVPCSIHGFVLDDGVAVFRPVELISLRAPTAPRLCYCGCATFFDPPAEHVETMRAAAGAVGRHLKATVDFRGAFTLDGIASADGWVATECNPRFGAGLGYVEAALPGLAFEMLHHAVIDRAVDVPSAALEAVVVDAANRTRWGTVSLSVSALIAATSATSVAGGAAGFRAAVGSEPADAQVLVGPGRAGGSVRVQLVAERTAVGPSIAPIARAALAFADGVFDLGIGPLAVPA